MFICLLSSCTQRINETSLKPWVIITNDGQVCCAHCTCMAGIPESCTHFGALLFKIEAALRFHGKKTVTTEAGDSWFCDTCLESHSCPKTYIVYYIYIYCIDTYLFITWIEIINVYLLLLHKKLHYLHFYLVYLFIYSMERNKKHIYIILHMKLHYLHFYLYRLLLITYYLCY